MSNFGLRREPRGALLIHQEPTFDGNLTDHIINWYIPREGAFEGFDEELQELMMRMTMDGHIAWVLFPTLLITEEDQVILML